MTYEQKRELAEWLVRANDECMLISGSIMLKEAGIDLGREPQDIDIITDIEDVDDMTFPPFFEMEKVESDNDGYTVLARGHWQGVKIEIIYEPHFYEIMSSGDCVDGYATVKSALDAKKRYMDEDENADYIEKTKRDIEIIEGWINNNKKGAHGCAINFNNNE